ncbi:uncharacterized protein KD926_006081 [Aspergillus affinis]|uniref:uncharacterized protein n=1 Tax=Aspergillus affinis TaxID=1070780 RepID=UPI0022FEF159|nr:uncharacterized protein KD926_006081 [Aspergillus affinis]KAI9042162.1 hypothetical protein KD926_006081 [Aspergillus affinis]
MSFLLTPVALGDLISLRNRVCMGSMTRNRCINQNMPTDAVVNHYATRARNGVGLMVAEGTFVYLNGAEWPDAPVMYNQQHANAWKKVTDGVHREGGKIFLQPWHPGRIQNENMPMLRDTGYPVLAPSKGYTDNITEIQDPKVIIEQYKNAIALAKEAGFDGIELLSQGGYLLHNFLCSHSNLRTDIYGGSVENRCRFVLEVTDAIIEVWGPRRVGIKICPSDDYNDSAVSFEELSETYNYLIRQLVSRNLGYINLSRRGCAIGRAQDDYFMPSPRPAGKQLPPNYEPLRQFGHLIKYPGSETMLMVNHEYTVAEADNLVCEGKIDLVTFGRPFIYNPCEGQKPSCSRCLNRNIPCHYQTQNNRQPAPKSYVLLLRNRIEALEHILRSHGIDVEASLSELVGHHDLLHPDDFNTSTDASINHSLSSDLDDLCGAFHGTLTFDEALNFDDDGEMRYFGPTSGRLPFQSSRDVSTNNILPVEYKEGPGLTGLYEKLDDFSYPMSEDPVPSDELKSHLFKLYFTWEQPWYQVVNEKLFRESLQQNGRFASPLLVNCILAIASRYSDRLDVRSIPDNSNSAGQFFLERAEVLLPFELKWPNITTLQSIAILGMVYVAMGQDAAGWLYQGMACRLALDMGLNVDSSALASKVSMPTEEAELRRQIYWSLYCHDKLAASYTGRVCTLLEPQGVVNLPSPSGTQIESRVVSLQLANIGICRILERILLSLWAPKPLLGGPKRSAFFDKCVVKLRSWYYDLPSDLKISTANVLPQVYTLHMVYYTVFILLSKPFLIPSGSAKKAGAAHDDQEITNKAKLLCDESARKMRAVAQKYRQEFGSFRLSPITATHCTLSAALVSLENYSFEVEGTKTEQHSLAQKHEIEAFLQTLKELSTSWYPAKCIHLHLGKLYQQTRERHNDKPATPEIETTPNQSVPQDVNRSRFADDPQIIPPLPIPASFDMAWDIFADPHILEDQTVLPQDIHGVDIEGILASDLSLSFPAHLPSDYNLP